MSRYTHGRGARRARPAGRGPLNDDNASGYPPRDGWGHREPASLSRRARRTGRRHRTLAVLSVATTVIFTATMLAAYAAYRNATDGLRRVDVTAQQLGGRPPAFDGSTNILVIGSDSRAGTHGQFGSAQAIQGARSDTIMVLHVAPTHSNAIVVSFPRDSMVPTISCPPAAPGAPSQQAAPGTLEMLNSTLNFGPACLWRTLEQTSRIHIDHFIEVNFSGFKQIVNDVHGVSVCLPFAIHDPASGLHLSAGPHLVLGSQALAFFRERHIGQGSDLQRIERQQFLLASLSQRVKSSGVLSSPVGLFHLVHDVASALTTDSSATQLYSIAYSLKNMSTSALRFVSVPVQPWPGDPQARVIWDQPQSDQLFTAIAHDSHLNRALRGAHSAGAGGKSSVSPSQVVVKVLNGSGASGVASIAASALTSRGFHISGKGNAPNFHYTSSVIAYSSAAQRGAASTLRRQVTGSRVALTPGVPAGTVELIIGSSFHGLASAGGSGTGAPGTGSSATGSPGTGGSGTTASTAKSASAAAVASQNSGINGNANICQDKAAFTGPDVPSDSAP